MAGNIPNQSSQTTKQLVDRIQNIGQLSRLDYLQLVSAFLSDYKVTDDERRQINLIFDDIQMGSVKIVD